MKTFLAFAFFFLQSAFAVDHYRENIQPIFDNRCIACHSCLNGPCQLNLQNYENFSRGANKQNVYNGTRIDSVLPSRPGIDGKSIADWRRLGFFDINQSRNLEENVFYSILGVTKPTQRDIPYKTVEESMVCVDTAETLKNLFKVSRDLQMPYALPPITEAQRKTIGTWLANGAPGPEKKLVPAGLKSNIREWENFFNQKSAEEKLVSRYLYEHLFLAHLYFSEAPTRFFRLVRSKTKCEDGIDEIATRRPNDNPGMNEFYYCLDQIDATIVAKTHMPFELTTSTMKRWRDLFFSEKWKVSKEEKESKVSYALTVSENPFVAFFDIPVRARYQFMLDHAHYIISTFIKGPVCNGSNAVNSIQEQFYVLFLDPKSDNMVISKDYEKKARDLLILPGVWGSDIKLASTLSLTKKIVEHREGYRKLRAEETKINHPKGYALSDLWDGDGINNNAVLTVFRHNDNAVVIKGFKGDLPKTFFFLDYALMERLVYNLVVNFDVFGNISHQTMTRIYMDLIRMEAEEMFLSFLPPETRIPLRKSWYKGLLTEAKMKYMFPLVNPSIPTQVVYQTKNPKKEFVDLVRASFRPQVTGEDDTMNWKTLVTTKPAETPLRELTSVKAIGRQRFPNFFPENSYLLVKREGKPSLVYTVIKNREHENISWILNEDLRLAPKEDTLTILEGFYSYYPNKFFVVNENRLKEFKDKVLKIRIKQDYQDVVKEFAVSRVGDNFWEIYDELNSVYKKDYPIDFGYLDLTRYDME